MKTWMILGVVVVLVLVAGIFVSANLSNDQENNQEDITSGTCDSGSCPNAATGGCGVGDNCGLSTCGATRGSSCGCGR